MWGDGTVAMHDKRNSIGERSKGLVARTEAIAEYGSMVGDL